MGMKNNPLFRRVMSLSEFLHTVKLMNYPYTVDISYSASFYIFPKWDDEPYVCMAFEGPETTAEFLLSSIFSSDAINTLCRELDYNSNMETCVDVLGAAYIDYFQVVIPNHRLNIPEVINTLLKYRYVNPEVVSNIDKQKRVRKRDNFLLATNRAEVVDDVIYYDFEYLPEKQRSYIFERIPNYNAYRFSLMASSTDTLKKILKEKVD